jgi:hypothetical protein
MFGQGLAGFYREPGKVNGIVTHAAIKDGYNMKFNQGQLHPQMPIPPLNMIWEGYLDNIIDQSSASLFANARHGANKKISLLTISVPEVLPYTGGEGRDTTAPNFLGLSFGLGVRSLNTFELTQLV